MHVVTLSAPVDTGDNAFGVLEAGEWMMHDKNAFEVALIAERGTATLDRFRLGNMGRHADKPLIMRSGAIGDLLLMLPAIKAYKLQCSLLKISLCCRKEHFQIFKGTDLFESLVPYPLAEKYSCGFSNIISLENVMELARDRHATDAFADALGVTVEDYKPVYVVTEEEKRAASIQNDVPVSHYRPRVGMQLRASVRNRDYPASQWGKVMLGLVERGWEVFMFGLPGQIPPLPDELKSPYIHDCSRSGMTFRGTAAMLSLCDAFVGVDSALLHLCHALDIPAVGLYAAFDWKIRTSKAPKTYALTGVGECAPCFWHMKNGRHFPPDKPCSKRQLCTVLASIPPERIIAKIDALKP